MPARSWRSLGDAQRRRYITAGRTGTLSGARLTPAQVRAYYERGGDLRRGRGHMPTPRGAAPLEATERSSVGMGTTADAKALAQWRRTSAPAWIPRSRAAMGDDIAASLSRIGIPPKRWKSVVIESNRDGTYTMIVTPRVGYPRTTILADADAVSEVGRLVNASSRADMAASPAERRRMEREWRTARGAPVHMTMTVQGYRGPGSAPPAPPTEPAPRGGAPMARTPQPEPVTVGDLFTRPRTRKAKAAANKKRTAPVPRRERLLAAFGLEDLLADALTLFDEGVTEFTDDLDAELDQLARQVEKIEQLLRAARRKR